MQIDAPGSLLDTCNLVDVGDCTFYGDEVDWQIRMPFFFWNELEPDRRAADYIKKEKKSPYWANNKETNTGLLDWDIDLRHTTPAQLKHTTVALNTGKNIDLLD